MSELPTRRGRGRPRDPAKRAALLAAGRSLFLEHGVDAVTLDQVIALAAVSRATLYSNFSDKNELLTAVIAQESERLLKNWVHDHAGAPVREALLAFGRNLLPFIADADVMAFERLVGQAAIGQPAHGTSFFAAGPEQTRDLLKAIIETAQANDELAPCDAEEAANDLLGLWQGFWRLELQYGFRADISPAELERLAEHGVKQFLKLYSDGETA